MSKHTHIKEWVEKEFESLDYGDKRLEKRASKVLGDFAAMPEGSIPQASGNWAASKGCYRLFDNGKVRVERTLEAHRQASIKRSRGQGMILAIQDTTFLNYSHPATQGLGRIDSQQQAKGMLLHTVLAVSSRGQALGILDAQFVIRKEPKDEAKGKSKHNRVAIEQKESGRWLRGFERAKEALEGLEESDRLLVVADREGDIYELLELGVCHHQRCDVLVRGRHDRRLKEEGFLWEQVQKQAVALSAKLRISRQPSKIEEVEVEVRFCKMQIAAPLDKQRYFGKEGSLDIYAIDVRQVRGAAAGSDGSRLHWKLLTSMEVSTLQEAFEIVSYYTLRWKIEQWHKVLKSGCRAEERQLETAQRLQRLLAFDIIIAWRLLALTDMARNDPQQSCISVMEKHQWQTLFLLVHPENVPPPTQAPTIAEVVNWLARLGGFLNRKGDGPPGVVTLWRGWSKLSSALDGLAAAQRLGLLVGND